MSVGYFGWVGVVGKIFWVGGGEWRCVGAGEGEWGWVQFLIMPLANKHSRKLFSLTLALILLSISLSAANFFSSSLLFVVRQCLLDISASLL